jgi:hypothetical protein
LPRDEYERFAILAAAGELPPIPAPDARGNYPAVQYARASLARKIIRDRSGRADLQTWGETVTHGVLG